MTSITTGKQVLSAEQRGLLMTGLAERFAHNPQRHAGLDWAVVKARLEANPAKLWCLQAMEASGGEPDVVGTDPSSGEVLFFDCTKESPLARRNLCYDRAALESRKAHKPQGSAVEMAESMGIRLLTEAEYLHLQTLGEFDLKSSSWLATPESVRNLGGALFGDRRFGRVFVYHNGAESYYGVRGWRGVLRV